MKKKDIVLMLLIIYISFLTIQNNLLKDKLENQDLKKTVLLKLNLKENLLEKKVYNFWFKN